MFSATFENLWKVRIHSGVRIHNLVSGQMIGTYHEMIGTYHRHQLELVWQPKWPTLFAPSQTLSKSVANSFTFW